jgi:predicted O-methyltransferase YrrM
MKAKIDAIIQREQAEYLENLHYKSTGLIAEMETFAATHRVPISDREVASFLAITAKAIGAKRVLEIGLAIGYGAIHLLRWMPDDGVVVAIEPDSEMIARADEFLTKANMRDRVEIKEGKALNVLPGLDGPFDLVYLDAVKEEYWDYLELSLPLLRVGGVVVCDNLLWGGKVANANGEDVDAATAALREFNKKFARHPHLHAEVLSFGDGLGYGVKLV